MTTLARMREIRSQLRSEFYERDEAIEALLLAVLTRQHAFILGPPGTAKSLLVRALVDRITGATYFEQLLSKNRPDSAVLGPYDLPLLRDKGEFLRKDKGYLTSVDFAFLDEVGKASPTIGHDLLAALNERIKHQVGDKTSVQPIPLHSAFTASNELLAQDSQDEAALWDRLLIRCTVDYIAGDSDFRALMERADAPATPASITFDDLKAAVDDVAKVVLLDDVLNGVIKIRSTLRREGITISDRRWRESMKVVRAAAWLAGRPVASLQDLSALRYTLWEDLEQRSKIDRVVLEVANPFEAEMLTLLDDLEALRAQLHAAAGQSQNNLVGTIGTEVFGKLNVVNSEVKRLKDKAKAEGVDLDATRVETKSAAVTREAYQVMGMPVPGEA